MTSKDAYIRQLLELYMAGTITKSEMDQLFDDIKEHGVPEGVADYIARDLLDEGITPEMQSITEQVEQSLRSHLLMEKLERSEVQRQKMTRKRVYGWAAVTIGVLLLGAWFWFLLPSTDSSASNMELAMQMEGEFIEPAGNKATLLLPDGRRIVLDESREGIVVDGSRIVYQGDDAPVTALPELLSSQEVVLSTPRGGTYHVTLPDGTEVWLNASSTLTYPTQFTGNERRVRLEGEAYFDVQRMEREGTHIAFVVSTAQQEIEVLGTEFNVSAYPDETSATTLVTGAVGLTPQGGKEQVVLSPGEQGWVENDQIARLKVDVRDYVDWKNGEFVFRNERTDQVFQRLARWYDVDVAYEEESVLNERFSGTISRYGHLQTILDIMEEAGDLHFNVSDREVRVSRRKTSKIKNKLYEE